MTGTENSERRLAGRIGWPHLFGAAFLALVLAVVVVAASGVVAAQDQPENPVNIYGDAVDELGNAAQTGTTIYAVVDGVEQDNITVGEPGQFGGGEGFDDKLVVEAGAGSEVVFTIDSPDGTMANETVDLSTADEVEEVSLTFPVASFAEIDVNNDGFVATDTSGDGLLNDVDGDGEFDIFDVQTFFNYYNDPVVQNNKAAFNFDGRPGIDIFDVQALFNRQIQ